MSFCWRRMTKENLQRRFRLRAGQVSLLQISLVRLSCGEGIYGIFKDLGQIDGKKEAPFSNGGGSDLYCSALRPLLVTTIDHYWSASGAVLLPSPTSSDRWQVFARRKRGRSVFCEEDTLHLDLHSRAESHDTAKDYTTSWATARALQCAPQRWSRGDQLRDQCLG